MVSGWRSGRIAMHGPRRIFEVRAAAAASSTAGVGTNPAVAQEVVLVEHETFPAQLLRELDLLEDLRVIFVVRRIELRKIGRQNIDVKFHRAASESIPARQAPQGRGRAA